MRKWLLTAIAGLLLSGVAGPALAASLAFTGSLSVQIANLDPVVLPGSGTAIVNGSSGTGHLSSLAIPKGVFAVTAFIVPVTDPGAFPIAGVQVTAENGDGSFSGQGGAGHGGIMPIQGASKVCLFGPCTDAVANLNVPLSVVGAGGTAYVNGAVNLTVVGAPWTTGTAAVGLTTLMGGVDPSSNTAAPSGHVTLVTPVFISTNIGGSAVVPAFATLSLHFVPEPGTLFLLGAGVAGLIAVGRARDGD